MTAENAQLIEPQEALPVQWGRRTLLVAVLLMTVALLFWQMTTQTQRPWTERDTVDVSLGGEHYRLDSRQLAWLEEFSIAHFSGDALEARRIVETQIDAQLDSTFREVSARLPLFADWYYSLGGEYSRLSMAVLSSMDLADGDFVARRAAEILFPDEVWTATLSQLDSNAAGMLEALQASSREGWLLELQQRLATQKVPPPIPGLTDTLSGPDLLVLDSLALRLQTLDQQAVFETRTTLSTIGAIGVAGPALWRAVAARNAVNAARAAAVGGVAGSVTRGTASVAARGASRAGSAAAGAAVCLPGGPIALACAAVAGAATWLATDWLLLRVDDALNREELLAGLEAGLTDLRGGLEQELLEAYDERIAVWQQATLVEIENSFSPAAN
ncbi:MAG: hypothetical protein WBJ75_01920 [Pseudohongiellaceae bacterium]